MFETFAIFIFMTGFIVGLGAVTVIDIHGFLGRTSPYWTEATIRTHKVTKPLIWVGSFLAILGGVLVYSQEPLNTISLVSACIAVVLIINGAFLSGVVSPFLLSREREGRAREPLPQSWQYKIAASLIVSDIGWWTALVLFVIHLTS